MLIHTAMLFQRVENGERTREAPQLFVGKTQGEVLGQIAEVMKESNDQAPEIDTVTTLPGMKEWINEHAAYWDVEHSVYEIS